MFRIKKKKEEPLSSDSVLVLDTDVHDSRNKTSSLPEEQSSTDQTRHNIGENKLAQPISVNASYKLSDIVLVS